MLTCTDKYKIWLEPARCWLDDLLQHLLHRSMARSTWQDTQHVRKVQGFEQLQSVCAGTTTASCSRLCALHNSTCRQAALLQLCTPAYEQNL
jgi:hypothetical protein